MYIIYSSCIDFFTVKVGKITGSDATSKQERFWKETVFETENRQIYICVVYASGSIRACFDVTSGNNFDREKKSMKFFNDKICYIFFFLQENQKFNEYVVK